MKYNEIWADANWIIDYWMDHKLSKKQAIKAAMLSSFLLANQNELFDKNRWQKIYLYLKSKNNSNETETKNYQGPTSNR